MLRYDRPITQLQEPLSVTTPDPSVPSAGSSDEAVSSRPERRDDQPVSRLRGAGAQVDPRRAAQVVVGLVLVTLLVLTVVFTVVGARKNQQIDELQRHGVPVTFTVTECVGLLGGSGSNGAGYACRGTYQLGGRRYTAPLPGYKAYAPGDTVRVIAVPSDPTLMSTAAMVQSERTSSTVFILPAVFFALFLLIVSAVALVRVRRGRLGRAD